MLFPNHEKIYKTLGAAPVRHGYIFVVYKLVDMAAEEADKPAAIEHSAMHSHGKLIRVSKDNDTIHFYSLIYVDWEACSGKILYFSLRKNQLFFCVENSVFFCVEKSGIFVDRPVLDSGRDSGTARDTG